MIYVKFKIPDTIEEFLKQFFLGSETTYGNTTVVTYRDKECTRIQCEAGRMRSFDDLLTCVNTYYDKITPKDLFHELITLELKNRNNIKLSYSFACCHTMNRVRIWFPPSNQPYNGFGRRFDGVNRISHYTVYLMTVNHGEKDIEDCKLMKTIAKKEKKTEKTKLVEGEIDDPFLILEQRIIKSFPAGTLKFGGDFKRARTEKKPEFMANFFDRNNKYNTIFSLSQAPMCSVGRRRSLGDIYMMVKYYYPRATLSSIIPYLYGEDKLGNLKSQFCSSTNKRVFRRDDESLEGRERHPNDPDEYGNLPKFYLDGLKVLSKQLKLVV